MTGIAAVERLPAMLGVPPRHAPVLEKQQGDNAFDAKKTEANEAAIKRRTWAENLRRIGDTSLDLGVKTLLAGGAVLLADENLHNFITNPVRDTILNVGTVALGASAATAIGTKVSAEFIASPDKEIDKIAEQSMKLNRAGGMQLAAKIGKFASLATKMGAIGIAGVALGEGVAHSLNVNFGDAISYVDNFIPKTDILEPIVTGVSNISYDVTPSMVVPAAGLAVGAEIMRRNFALQEKMYDSANKFMQVDPGADKKSTERTIYDASKKDLAGNLNKLISAKLWTGDALGSLFWYIQKLKFKYEGMKGSGVATLPEIVRKNNRKWENLIVNLKGKQSLPFIAAGITGLLAPDLNGPLAGVMDNVSPAVWSGLALTGAAKYSFFDKPAADYLDSVRKAVDYNLSSGRDKHRVPNT
jgi:hypothetical protein